MNQMLKKASSVCAAAVCAASLMFSGASVVMAGSEIDEEIMTQITMTAEGLTQTIIPLSDEEIEAYLDTFTIKRDGAEYVTELEKDGNPLDVDAFVQAFELASPCFFLKEMDGHIRIVIKGCGHGYGLSTVQRIWQKIRNLMKKF